MMSHEEHNHEELNDQLQVRRDKMNQLRENGKILSGSVLTAPINQLISLNHIMNSQKKN